MTTTSVSTIVLPITKVSILEEDLLFRKLDSDVKISAEEDKKGVPMTSAIKRRAIPIPIPVVSNLVHTCFPKSVA